MNSDPTTTALIVSSGLFAGGAAFATMYPLIRAILAPMKNDVEAWHREARRWGRLRVESPVFRSFERWIIGVSMLIETRMPWFLKIPTTKQAIGKMLRRLFMISFGNPKTLEQSVRVRSYDEPWSHSEAVATALLLACFAAIFVISMLTTGGFTLITSIVASMITFIGCYRFWVSRFNHKAHLRQQRIRQFLPHAMDCVAMVIAAGGDFTVGIKKVAEDFPGHPLSDEFQRILTTTNRGRPLGDSLNVASRFVCLPEFDEMVRAMNRIGSHGSTEKTTFTNLARRLRKIHLRHMEEKVGHAEAAMEFPTVMVLFSAVLVAVAPFALSIMRSEIMN